MLVGSHATRSTLDSITISVDNKHLDEVQSFPYLGLHSFFIYKNIFYKNIEAEICEILRIF